MDLPSTKSSFGLMKPLVLGMVPSSMKKVRLPKWWNYNYSLSLFSCERPVATSCRSSLAIKSQTHKDQSFFPNSPHVCEYWWSPSSAFHVWKKEGKVDKHPIGHLDNSFFEGIGTRKGPLVRGIFKLITSTQGSQCQIFAEMRSFFA